MIYRMSLALAAGLAAVSAQAAIVDVVEAPTGFFVPSDIQKYYAPYYRGFGEDWDWTHNPIAAGFTSATLYVSAFDVDSCCGEFDAIDVMDDGVWTFVGSLTGTDNVWDYGNSFALGANFFNDIQAGLRVRIRIDLNQQGWLVTLGKSVLTTDGAAPPPPTPGAIPEPGTWAMLIAGFGLIGAVSRRRRRLAPAIG